ncbi:heme exporter protein CcmD [Curvibacter sp. APW13]|uniref:heme exporter protein CcmD n=1 Tax=Curvibacter sp. APW13 TaxID=3077236 RepID=UPI0028DE4B79|nr:heme exporter protein CcmD [Curvibacter sp. APW13]MDT8991886.1 heme exporter protein CcmD [Curvibacter sp. APW13]
MQWNSIQEFLHMGGYALYVWGSFGATAAVVAMEVLQARAHRKSVIKSLAMELEHEDNTP